MGFTNHNPRITTQVHRRVIGAKIKIFSWLGLDRLLLTSGGGTNLNPMTTLAVYTPVVLSLNSFNVQVDSLYSGESGSLTVNSMNAPNNSTLQVN